MTSLTTSEYVQMLTRLANLYLEHPEAELPYEGCHTGMSIYCHDKETFSATVAAFGGGAKDSDDAGLIYLPNAFKKLHLRIYGFKSGICERIEDGTKVIPEQVIPAREEEIIPEHEEPVYKWNCKPFLDGNGSGSEAQPQV